MNLSIKSNFKSVANLLLILLLVFLTTNPWGPFETRDFSYMTPTVSWGFNAFIECVIVATIVAIVRAWLSKKDALWLAISVG